MKPRVQRTRGFTLVELLVVISIIAVLASVAIPAFTGAQMTAQINAASQNARGIFLGLSTYAVDQSGTYPVAENNSNEAFRQLMPNYIDNEKPFYVGASAWHQAAKGGKPDEDIGNAPEYQQALERGENHWAYISGLNNTSTSSIPIIADGFTDTPGVYTNIPNQKGGRWKGTKAIMVYLDGQAKPEALDTRPSRS